MLLHLSKKVVGGSIFFKIGKSTLKSKKNLYKSYLKPDYKSA